MPQSFIEALFNPQAAAPPQMLGIAEDGRPAEVHHRRHPGRHHGYYAAIKRHHAVHFDGQPHASEKRASLPHAPHARNHKGALAAAVHSEAISGKNSGENWTADDSLKAASVAAHDTGMKFPKLLQAVINNESSGNYAIDGYGQGHVDKHGHVHRKIVSRGLMQIKDSTMFGILDEHKEKMQGLLSKPEYGDRFKPVLDWMKGDHSPATHDAVIKKMYDPQFSAYAGAMYLKDQGADRNPAQAYLNYVSPQMGAVVAHAMKTGAQGTAVDLAAQNGVAPDVVTNNPAVFGQGGSYTAAEIIAHNNQKFGGVVPAQKPPVHHHHHGLDS